MSSTFNSGDRKIENRLASSFMLESNLNQNTSQSELSSVAPTTPIKKSCSMTYTGKRGNSQTA